MSQRSSGSAGPGSDDWPDDLWPGDDDPPGGGHPGGGAPGGPRAAPAMPPGWSEDRPPSRRPGHTVTAAVTGSTRVTGKVSGISGVKVGDQVSAQIVQNGGAASATAIQDPARPPAGGTVP
jgi:hypothetical protein